MALLVDRKRPRHFSEMILDSNTIDKLQRMLEDPFNKMVNMTLSGLPGVGKTTIAKIFRDQLGAETLWRNASDHNNVDSIRALKDFTGSMTMNDTIKLVVLDEADCLSIGKAGAAGAQEILRGIIEESQEDTRFILTCNYPQRIIPALLSRCPIINIQFTPKMVMERVMSILKEEGVKASKEDLKIFYDIVVKRNFPKVRNIIHILDSCIVGNEFNIQSIYSTSEISTDFDNFIDEFLEAFNKNKKTFDIRKFYIENSDRFEDDYIKFANAMFLKFMDNPIQQITIADYIYKMGTVIDPEIQFYAMILDLKNN